MSYTAIHRFARISPRKARLMMDLVRGRDVDDALTLLRFSTKRVSVMIEKVIKSAVANAAEQSTAPAGGVFYVRTAYVDPGPVIKRIMQKDRGKAYEIKKRTSHLFVTIDERDGDSLPIKGRATGRRKKARAGTETGTEAGGESGTPGRKRSAARAGSAKQSGTGAPSGTGAQTDPSS